MMHVAVQQVWVGLLGSEAAEKGWGWCGLYIGSVVGGEAEMWVWLIKAVISWAGLVYDHSLLL